MSAVPRFATVLPAKRLLGGSWASEIEAAAVRLGTPLLPWQSEVARLIGARSKDGLPRFKTVVVSVPRQQGKSVLSKAFLLAAAERADGQHLFGTAQTRQYAARHCLALGLALGGDVKVLRGVGAESVTWPNGSTYLPLSPSESGGHGDSIDQIVVDEAWTLEAHVLGGIRPAMIARPLSQMFIISTMGTVESVTWNGIVERGRESVGDPEATTAYVEFSAPTDEAILDESLWASWMPALGYTVRPEDIRMAMEDMEPSEAVRAFGNRVTQTLSVVFPDEWVSEAWRVIDPPAQFVVAVDVNNDPAGATVATGHIAEDDTTAVRAVEWRLGSPQWVPGLVDRMIQGRKVDAVVADFGGPARVLRAELEAVCRSTPLVDRLPRDMAANTIGFHDALKERRVVLEKSQPLVDALAGAHRKAMGDLWLVSRRPMSVDASPVNAAILAHGLAVELGVRGTVKPFVL